MVKLNKNIRPSINLLLTILVSIILILTLNQVSASDDQLHQMYIGDEQLYITFVMDNEINIKYYDLTPKSTTPIIVPTQPPIGTSETNSLAGGDYSKNVTEQLDGLPEQKPKQIFDINKLLDEFYKSTLIAFNFIESTGKNLLPSSPELGFILIILTLIISICILFVYVDITLFKQLLQGTKSKLVYGLGISITLFLLLILFNLPNLSLVSEELTNINNLTTSTEPITVKFISTCNLVLKVFEIIGQNILPSSPKLGLFILIIFIILISCILLLYLDTLIFKKILKSHNDKLFYGILISLSFIFLLMYPNIPNISTITEQINSIPITDNYYEILITKLLIYCNLLIAVYEKTGTSLSPSYPVIGTILLICISIIILYLLITYLEIYIMKLKLTKETKHTKK